LAQLAKPSLRGASPARQANALGIARSGPGSLRREGERVIVEARFDHGAAAGAAALRAAGAQIVNVSPRYQRVTLAARPADLPALADVARVDAIQEVRTPLLFAECPSGEVVSEGDTQLRAGEARALEGEPDGSGVTVGILSDSFDKATEAADGSGPIATKAKDDVEAGDLPGAKNPCGFLTPVDVLEDFNPGPEEAADEGRGMTQIVHDLAPGADLSFATAFNGLTEFAENVEALATAGANVIADDVAYFEEPVFQEGPVGAAIRKATEEGVTYFSAAGNDNLIDGAGRDISSWETPEFRDSGSCPSPLVALSEIRLEEEEQEQEEFPEIEFPLIGLNASHCLDFNPSKATSDRTFRITVEPHELLTLDVQWAEPWEGVESDIDAYLFSSGGVWLTPEQGTDDNVGKTQMPVEIMQWENETGTSQSVQLVINRYSGTLPRIKSILLQNGGGVSSVEYPESLGGDIVGPSIFGHAGDADTISVAAVPFSDSSEPEEYSSRGPVTHYFGPVAGSEPAEALASPEALSKPDLAATDCGVTSFFAFEELGDWRFCGTSAAAPHAAAVAALALSAEPSATPAQLREAEVNSAAPVSTFGSCAVGGGLVDAVETVQAVTSGEPGPAPEACTPPLSPPVTEPPETIPNVVPPPPPPPPPVTRPDTFIRAHPAKLVRTRNRRFKAVFRFGSDEAGSEFECRIDKKPFQGCPSRLVRRLPAGKHVIRARARADGAVDDTPAVFKFRIRRMKRPVG
jgi:subtilisin family serine protease